MKNLIPEVALLSASKRHLTPSINRRRHELMYDILAELGVNFVECQGVYKDSEENSFMVYLEPIKGFTEHFFARLACNKFEQECVLYRDKYKNGYLIDLDGNEEYIGTVDQLNREDVTPSIGFTRFSNGTYLGVVK